MAHVGVKGLAAPEGEQRSAQDYERKPPVIGYQGNGTYRVKRIENFRCLEDRAQAEQSKTGEPPGHDRAKTIADSLAAETLQEKHCDEDRDGDGHHEVTQMGSYTFSPSTALKTEIAGVTMLSRRTGPRQTCRLA